MTNEQFKVTFTADNQLSAELTKITHDLDATYKAAGKTTQGITALSKAFAPTASMTKFATGITNTQNALTTLTTSGLNTGRLNQISQSVTKLARALTSLSGVTVQQNLAAPLSKLSKLTVTPLTNSMHKLAIASGHVSRNLNSIVKSMSKLQSMGALNAKMTVTMPKTGGTGSTGGTGGAGGTTPQQKTGVQGFASSSGWRDFEKTLHIFNSLTYAVGTVQLAFQSLFDTIARGNELTKAQSLLMGVSQTKGMLLGTSAAERYSAAIRVAAKNQLLFGGSFAESINGILKLQQISISAGVSVEELNNVVQLLAMRDPIQGIEGATIAVQELMSGDPMSLRRRFELPSDEVNALANAAGDAKGQISGLTALLGTQGITAKVLADQLDTTAAAYARFGAVTSVAGETFGQGIAEMFKNPTEELTKFIAQSLYGYGSMSTSVGQFGNAISSVYMGPMASFLSTIPTMIYETSDMKYAFREANQEIFDSWIQMGLIHDPYRMKELEEITYGVDHYNAIANEMINTQMRVNDAFMQTGLVTATLGESIGDYITQMNQSNQVSRRELLLNAALIKAKTDFAGATLITARVFNITEKEASRLLKTLQTTKQFEEGGGALKDTAANIYGIEWPVEELNETAKATRAVADETKRLNEIYQDTMERLVEFDKEVYRKRIREMQSYYAEATLLQQQRAYEMRANDLDLVEGRNSKLEAADRQRLLARENIEAYGQLQMNQAVAKANEIALGGNAKFAQEYLKIQEDRISEGSKLYQQLHDTQVRLEGDPEAQQRAKQIYDESVKLMDEYYNTKVGLADAAAREQREEEASQRRQIIDDAIKSVLQLENVDETQRQAIIQGLEIAKTTITDLSNTYVDKVDAMRGSLNLLAEALAKVRNESNILTPQQLAAFNGMGMGQITAPPGGSVDVTQTTVNVGGINITVNSQVSAEEIRKIVLSTLQTQLNQRG